VLAHATCVGSGRHIDRPHEEAQISSDRQLLELGHIGEEKKNEMGFVRLQRMYLVLSSLTSPCHLYNVVFVISISIKYEKEEAMFLTSHRGLNQDKMCVYPLHVGPGRRLKQINIISILQNYGC
jgi:hypothetical protein